MDKIDLNPMAIFLVEALLTTTTVRQLDLAQAFEEVKDEYIKKDPKTKEETEKILKKYPGPKKLVLPKGSDVKTVDKLFSDIQMARLALLKQIIKKQKNDNVKKSLLLMFSGQGTRVNLTYHTSRENGVMLPH